MVPGLLKVGEKKELPDIHLGKWLFTLSTAGTLGLKSDSGMWQVV